MSRPINPPDHDDPFVDWDAAYVLGALSPQDRIAFEAHLRQCVRCTAAVAADAGLPGLLATVPVTDAQRIAELGPDATPPVPDTLLPRLLSSVHRRRRTRTIVQIAASGLVAAACLVLGLFIARPTPTPAPDVTVAMQAPDASPMDVTVSLRDVGWGTKVQVRCRYAADPYAEPRAYHLMLVDDAGVRQQVASWNSVPGASGATVDGGTALHRDQIARLEVTGAAGDVLMTATP